MPFWRTQTKGSKRSLTAIRVPKSLIMRLPWPCAWVRCPLETSLGRESRSFLSYSQNQKRNKDDVSKTFVMMVLIRKDFDWRQVSSY